MARLGCAFEGLIEPEIIWMKDGEKIYSTDQMYITLDAHHWETFYRQDDVNLELKVLDVIQHGCFSEKKCNWLKLFLGKNRDIRLYEEDVETNYT